MRLLKVFLVASMLVLTSVVPAYSVTLNSGGVGISWWYDGTGTGGAAAGGSFLTPGEGALDTFTLKSPLEVKTRCSGQ
jgi:hypothetical protein